MFRRRPRTTRTVTLCPYRRSSELAPAPDRAAGKIVGKVVVRRDPRPRSDPDALVGLARTEVDRIGRVEPVEMRRDVDGAEIDGARLSLILGAVDPGEDVGQLARSAAEIHRHVDRKSTRLNSSH